MVTYMNIILGFFVIFYIVFLTTSSIFHYYIKYIYSESVPFGLLQGKSHQKKPIENKTLINTGCDFLNLCNDHQSNKINGVSLSSDKKIIDISYYNSYIPLPFP
jgi:hypothetical protein